MKIRHGFAASVVGIVALGAAFPLSADAAGTGATSATITLSAGTLDITVPGGPVALATGTNTATGTSLSGALGPVTVADTRGVEDGGWTTTVVSTAFVPATDGSAVIPATGVGYAAGTITSAGTGTYTPTNQAAVAPGISAAVAVVTATAITGDQTATWSPTIIVTVPATASADTYTATITHSVA
jgi:hypothetical protein